MNKKALYKDIVEYYKVTQESMLKQAQYISHLEQKESALMNKVAEYVQDCIKSGEVPEFLANGMIETFRKDPTEIINFIQKKANLSTTRIGSASEIPTKKMDALSAWVNQ